MYVDLDEHLNRDLEADLDEFTEEDIRLGPRSGRGTTRLEFGSGDGGYSAVGRRDGDC